jgi:hypothetical protein
MAVVVEIHKLWSRTRASPNAGHGRNLAFGFAPFARREPGAGQTFEDSDFAFFELPDQEVLFPIAIDVRPAWRGVAGTFNADGFATGRETHGVLEFDGRRGRNAADEGDEAMCIHVVLLWF